MDIYTTAIVISLIVYIAVGNYAGRRVKDLDDYFVAGRRAPTVMIVGTLVASYLSTNTFMAETGMEIRGKTMKQKLLDHGLKTDASGDRIMFTPDVVEAAIASAPLLPAVQ